MGLKETVQDTIDEIAPKGEFTEKNATEILVSELWKNYKKNSDVDKSDVDIDIVGTDKIFVKTNSNSAYKIVVKDYQYEEGQGLDYNEIEFDPEKMSGKSKSYKTETLSSKQELIITLDKYDEFI